MAESAADETRTDEDRCPGCGATISPNAPEGLCVDCLMLLLDDYGGADPMHPEAFEGESLGEVGDYEILERIAAGGMGVVYKARQKGLHRLVALKLISEGKFAGNTDRERFLFEARAAGELDHPNIVPVYEVGEDQGQSFFSMRLVTGGDLGDRLVSMASTGAGETTLLSGSRERLVALVKLLVKVARAVHYAHEQGILHRDLKPSNILIDKHGEPQVSDFGLAKRVREVSDLTLSGQVLGSPAYMAPEQADGSTELTPAVDVYALGVILYQALTGTVPFGGDAPMAIVQQKLTREPKPPRRLQARVDRDLETVCLRCLERSPQKRYASAEALAEDLQRWLEGRPILAKPAGPVQIVVKWVRRKPAIAALILLSIVASVVLATIIGRHRAAQAENRRNTYAGEIALADERIRQNDLPGARKLLTKYADEDAADLRGIEWRLLWEACLRERPMNTFTIEGRRVAQLASEPTRPGALLVQLDDGTLLRGNAMGRELRPVRPGPESASWNFHFDGGGRFVLARDAEKGPYLLRGDLKQRWVLPATVVPPKNGFLAAVDLEESVLCVNGLRSAAEAYRVWDLTVPEPSGLPAPRDDLQAVAISPPPPPRIGEGKDDDFDRRYLAFCYWDKIKLAVWEEDHVRWLEARENGVIAKSGPVTAMAFSPSRQNLLTGDDSGLVRIYERRSGSLAGMREHEAPITALHSFVAEGGQHWIAAAGDDGRLLIWDMLPRRAKSPEMHRDLWEPMQFADDGTVLWAGSSDGMSVRKVTWTETEEAVPVVETVAALPENQTLVGIAAQTDQLWLIARGVTAGCQVYRVAINDPAGDLRPAGTLQNSESLRRIDFQTAAGKTWFAIGEGRLRSWNLTTGREAGLGLESSTAASWHAATVDPHRRMLLLSGKDASLQGVALDDATRNFIEFSHSPSNAIESPAEGMALSPDGKTLATYHGDGLLRLWQVSTGNLLLTMVEKRPWAAVRFSPDGGTLTASTRTGLLYRWKAPFL